VDVGKLSFKAMKLVELLFNADPSKRSTVEDVIKITERIIQDHMTSEEGQVDIEQTLYPRVAEELEQRYHCMMIQKMNGELI